MARCKGLGYTGRAVAWRQKQYHWREPAALLQRTRCSGGRRLDTEQAAVALADRMDSDGGDSNSETDLEDIADAYAAMDERRAIKALVRVGSL